MKQKISEIVAKFIPLLNYAAESNFTEVEYSFTTYGDTTVLSIVMPSMSLLRSVFLLQVFKDPHGFSFEQVIYFSLSKVAEIEFIDIRFASIDIGIKNV
jgi:hypothetical protein